ncbi:unnamed protein product [Caenorhabditis sp. 36 PRJEB53466]|nr:unnamed protein product [Caenorhabditis sp. 36 PRJEB53466]
MNSSFVSHGCQLMDLQSRQFVVYEEVLENFEEKCCEKHEPTRKAIAGYARSAFRMLKLEWAVREHQEHRELCNLAEQLNVDYRDVTKFKDNFLYHRFSLILASWCMQLTKIQAHFQAAHVHRLMTLKMPPGSHEVSENQLIVQIHTANLSYLALQVIDPLNPIFLYLLLQIAERSQKKSVMDLDLSVTALTDMAVEPEDQQDLLESVDALFRQAYFGFNESPTATLMELYAVEALSAIFGQQYEYIAESSNVDGITQISVRMFPTDYRVPLFRDLQYRLYCNFCCGEHLRAVNTYVQILEHILSRRSEWLDELIDYGYNFVLSNIYRLFVAMNNHRRKLGLITMY